MTDICSILAYQELVESGAAVRLRERVYWNLVIHGDCSSAELYAKANFSPRRQYAHGHGSRFSELERAGRIIKVGRRLCAVSGKLVNIYHALPYPWTPVGKAETVSYAELERRLERCQERCRELERKLNYGAVQQSLL